MATHSALILADVDTTSWKVSRYFDSYPGGGLITKTGVTLTFLGVCCSHTRRLERELDAYFLVHDEQEENPRILLISRTFWHRFGVQNRAVFVSQQPRIYEREVPDDVRDLTSIYVVEEPAQQTA